MNNEAEVLSKIKYWWSV